MSYPSPCKVGAGLILAGLGSSTVYAAETERWGPLFAALISIGLILACYEKLRRGIMDVIRPADDAYSEGYEAGYDKGWRDGAADAKPNLVLLKPTSSTACKFAGTCEQFAQDSASRASNE